MRIDRGMLGWGLFLIIAGGVPLAVRQGSLDAASMARAWELWPLLLIGAGLGLVLARTRAEPIGGIVVAATLGLMAGSFITGWTSPAGGASVCGPGDRAPFADATGTLAQDARVRLEMDCGDLVVAAGTGDGWVVSGSTPGGGAPRITGGTTDLQVRPPDRPAGISAASTQLHVGLPSTSRLTLDVRLNAGTTAVNLAGLQVPSATIAVNAGSARLALAGAAMTGTLDATVNAGSLTVALPGTGLDGSVAVNAGSARLCVPENAAIRLRVGDGALGATSFDGFGLERDGSTWATPGFATHSTVIDLRITANLGSVSLAKEADCD